MGLAAADSQFHVLAVDDSLIDRKLIERLLKTSSYQVTTVDSGSKALEFLGWHEEDERNNSSEETSVSPKTHQESSSLRNIPVVIMSSENVPSRITRCLEEGAEEFFLKPVRLSDVNKLKPHMMRTKCCNKDDDDIQNQKPENLEKQEINGEEIQSVLQLQQQQQQQPSQTNNNTNKRKSMDEGLSPDRTRPRYNGLTVMSN
ncbi:Two-component response regulator ARR9 [Sesamum angolense]|uniref:Two-component response regulator ARR9 n=1 Tax=Sesamum angolense TaxID=2727404 RepID=A0AAE1WFV0_9LAMI|nr:Two-component response regulator ARR9 [Sesamum angolense]